MGFGALLSIVASVVSGGMYLFENRDVIEDIGSHIVDGFDDGFSIENIGDTFGDPELWENVQKLLPSGTKE